MTVSIDWPTGVITVSKVDMVLIETVPFDIYELDIDAFRIVLRALEASVAGMAFLPTHVHVAPIVVGSITLAPVVTLDNGYTVTFEDDQYSVDLVGANSDIGDLINPNQVSVRSSNSAGLTSGDAINTELTYIRELIEGVVIPGVL